MMIFSKWPLNNIGTISQVIAGQSPPSSTYNDNGIGLPFFQGKADFGEIYPKTKCWCNSPIKIAKERDILLSVRAPVGPTNICNTESCIGRGLSAIRPGPDVYYKYLFHFFRRIEKWLSGQGRGSTFAAITQSEIKRLKIPLPPLDIQRKIAAVLDKADGLRQLRKAAIEKLDQLTQSVFLDMFGDPVTNPKGWENVKIKDLCNLIVDCPHSTPKYSDLITPYPCIRSSDIQNGFLDFSTTKYVDKSNYLERTKRYIPAYKDIVYCREGARFGMAAYIPKGITPCLGQRIMLLKANDTLATPEFLWAVMDSECIYNQAERSAFGAASPHVNVKDVKTFETFLPPLNLQQKFAKIFESVETTKTNMQKALDKQNDTFNSLLQRAFKGELDFNDHYFDILSKEATAEA
jgi:type I restriction enzyme S subunit